MKVGYSGTEGAFAHIATKKLFPVDLHIAYPDFSRAYKAVENGECDFAVLPIENSYHGEVGQVMDLLFSGSLVVTRTLDLKVSQNLLAVPGATLDDIKEVVSHPQGLGQCAEYLCGKGFKQSDYVNTALAAKYVSEKGDKSIAAISSVEAAELYGLEVLERDINASDNNTTRFVVCSKTQEVRATEDNEHAIMMFSVKNIAGALGKAIEIIGKYGFNMTAIRSRPMKGLLWQYYFYIEIEGDIYSGGGKEMLQEISSYCDNLKVVGTY